MKHFIVAKRMNVHSLEDIVDNKMPLVKHRKSPSFRRGIMPDKGRLNPAIYEPLLF